MRPCCTTEGDAEGSGGVVRGGSDKVCGGGEIMVVTGVVQGKIGVVAQYYVVDVDAPVVLVVFQS